MLGQAGAGRTAGGAKPQYAAGDRSPRIATALRATTAWATLRRATERTGSCLPSQCCDQDQRRLHIVAPALPIQRHMGSTRPHLRRFWVRPLHVGHRPTTRAVALLTYK